MIITGETPRLSSQEISGGGTILSMVGIFLFAGLLAVGAKEYVEWRVERMQREKKKTDNDSV